jgi:uncharacterized protein (DUF1499 family)
VKRAIGWIVVLALLGAGAWAATAWPHLNEVETGRTPEYPDLRVRAYDASVARVSHAVEEALAALPRWSIVGSGEGPQGAFVTAVHEAPLLRLKDDVTIRIRREGGRTTLRARSRSRFGPWDFGRNARNLRELLAAVDARLK